MLIITDYPSIQKGIVPSEFALNTVFKVVKGKRSALYKIVMHPHFPESYALVRDYPMLRSCDCTQYDYDRICGGCLNLAILGAPIHGYVG